MWGEGSCIPASSFLLQLVFFWREKNNHSQSHGHLWRGEFLCASFFLHSPGVNFSKLCCMFFGGVKTCDFVVDLLILVEY